MEKYADIVVPLARGVFTFRVDGVRPPEPGAGVEVVVGARKRYLGIVWRVHDRRPDFRTKPVERVVTAQPLLTPLQMRLWEWVADYYMCSLGDVMRFALPAALKPAGLTAEEFRSGEYRPVTVRCVRLAEELAGEEGYTTLERTGVRPSLDVNGIWGGYIEEGTKTIIPSKASAKISMRLVPNQDYRKISELFQRHFEAVAPKCVKVRVKSLHGGMPYVAPTDMPAYKAAERAVEEVFGKKPLPFYSGGSIPVISGFESILGVKSLLMGFGLGEDAIHSPNESYGLDQFFRGVETIPLFYKYFAELK